MVLMVLEEMEEMTEEMVALYLAGNLKNVKRIKDNELETNQIQSSDLETNHILFI